MSARSEILQRIQAALADVPDDEPADRDIARGYRRAGALDRAQVLDLFAERVADYRATVHRTSRETLSGAVAEILAVRALHRIAVPADLDDLDWPDGLEVVRDDGLTAAELDRIDGAVTTAAVGIAETGTLILNAGPGQGRRILTLVPDYHLCLIDAADIVESVPEANDRLDPVKPITLISGPSATSDIEFNRVEGVHGPRTLDVLVVEP